MAVLLIPVLMAGGTTAFAHSHGHHSRSSDQSAGQSSATSNGSPSERNHKGRNVGADVADKKNTPVNTLSGQGQSEKNSNTVETRGRTVSPIDTGITVQSKQTKNNTTKIRDLKASARTTWPHHAPQLRQSNRGREVRNAVGISVERNDTNFTGHKSEHPNAVVSASVAPTVEHDTALAKANAEFSAPKSVQPNTIAPIRPINLNPGMIDGTGLGRPSVGSSVIGGPARSFAGLSGTAIRPKH
jgi:hypothetical protein